MCLFFSISIKLISQFCLSIVTLKPLVVVKDATPQCTIGLGPLFPSCWLRGCRQLPPAAFCRHCLHPKPWLWEAELQETVTFLHSIFRTKPVSDPEPTHWRAGWHFRRQSPSNPTTNTYRGTPLVLSQSDPQPFPWLAGQQKMRDA